MKNGKKAFTLVELLVVVSIIALLLAVLMPALNKARDLGKRTVCSSLLRAYGMANMAYAAANSGWFVPFSQKYTGSDNKHTWDERWCENKMFRDYISVSARVKITDGGWNDAFQYPAELRCPSQIIKNIGQYTADINATEGWAVVMSYGYNCEQWRFNGGNLNINSTWWPSGIYCGNKQSDVKRPSAVMMFIDGNYYQARYIKADYKNYWDLPETGGGLMLGGNTLTRYNMGMVSYRHNQGACLAYFDGHSGYLKKDNVWFDADNEWLQTSNVRNRKPNILWDVKTNDLTPRSD